MSGDVIGMTYGANPPREVAVYLADAPPPPPPFPPKSSNRDCRLLLLESNAMSSLINPRRTCAARVTVVCWPHSCVSVCLSVCYHASEGIARFYAKKEIHTALV